MPTTDPVPGADALGARRIVVAVDEIVACLRTHEAELVGGRGPGGIVIGKPGELAGLVFSVARRSRRPRSARPASAPSPS